MSWKKKNKNILIFISLDLCIYLFIFLPLSFSHCLYSSTKQHRGIIAIISRNHIVKALKILRPISLSRRKNSYFSLSRVFVRVWVLLQYQICFSIGYEHFSTNLGLFHVLSRGSCLFLFRNYQKNPSFSSSSRRLSVWNRKIGVL